MSRNRKSKGSSSELLDEFRQGFDGLFGALGEVIAEVSERLEIGEAHEVRKSFEVDTGKGPVRAEAGLRVRFADPSGDARATAEPIGSKPVNPDRTASSGRAPKPAPARSIAYEIVEDGQIWRLTADIPGVEMAELSLSDVDGELVIETTGSRRFLGSCPLPQGMGARDFDVSLRNGILELTGHIERASE